MLDPVMPGNALTDFVTALCRSQVFTWFPTGCQLWPWVVERLMHKVKRLKTEDKSEDGQVRYGTVLSRDGLGGF